jgi:DNA-binding transcriptional ArsR family regulator
MTQLLKSNDLQIDTITIKKAAMVLRALNHKLRQQMLTLIDKKHEITVTEIYIILRLEQSVASQHLAILRHAGFVNTLRVGKHIYYSVNYERIQQVEQLCKDFIRFKS